MTGLRAGRGCRAERGRPRLGAAGLGWWATRGSSGSVTNGQSLGAGRGSAAIVGRVIVHAMTARFAETEPNEPAGGPLPRVATTPTDPATASKKRTLIGRGVVLCALGRSASRTATTRRSS